MFDKIKHKLIKSKRNKYIKMFDEIEKEWGKNKVTTQELEDMDKYLFNSKYNLSKGLGWTTQELEDMGKCLFNSDLSGWTTKQIEDMGKCCINTIIENK